MTKPQLFTAVFFAILLLLLYQIALMFRPFLFPVLWAVILAHMTYPVHVRLTARLGGRDALSAWCLTLGVLAVVVVPISNPAGRNMGGEHALEALSASTGGRAFYPRIGAQLDQAFAEILRDLRTQYLLGYYPTRVPTGGGAFHTVRVELPRRPELRISTRTGYYGEVSR